MSSSHEGSAAHVLTSVDLKTLKGIISAKLKGETQSDDKTMIMERTIQLVAGLPNNSKTQEVLTNSFIDQLWNSLDHPAMLYMGDEFKWRRPDGSYNVSGTSEVFAICLADWIL